MPFKTSHLILEYDDGDGDQSHEDYSYSSGSQHETTPNKRRLENGQSSSNDLDDSANDDTDDRKDGESSTSSSSDNVPKKKRRKEFLNLNATFMAGVQNVHLVTDQVLTH